MYLICKDREIQKFAVLLKLETWFFLWNSFLLMFCFNFTNLAYELTWHTVVWAGAPNCYGYVGQTAESGIPPSALSNTIKTVGPTLDSTAKL